MYLMTTVIGLLFFSHGLFWAVIHLVRPHMFKRGYTLAQRLGIRNPAVYYTCFVVVPLVVGTVLLTAGMGGLSLSDGAQ